MALLPNFPISGDDYTVGTITTVAGSKEFKTKDAYLQSYGAVQAGDHIYIASAGKFLIIGSITGENSGTLTDPCPDDCAVTDADLRIIFKTASSRLQGRTAMLIERLSKGCLASLAELSPREGQIFRATGVEGQLEAVDNSAAFVEETDDRKFMPPVIPAGKIEETDDRKFMTAAERVKLSNINALAAAIWNAGTDSSEALISPAKLRDAIDARFGGSYATGWAKMPNGLLLQWGTVTSDKNGFAGWTYPTAFTKVCKVFTTMRDNWGVNDHIPLAFPDLAAEMQNHNHLTVGAAMCRQVNGASGVTYINGGTCDWFAIGY